MQKQPLILTLKLNEESQAFFNEQRRLYFPPERNFLDAHLTLFHQLPDEPATSEYLAGLNYARFSMEVTGLMNLGAGVAYRIKSPELTSLHKSLSLHFKEILIPQDRQGFRPHITVLNKSTPENAQNVLNELTPNFQPFNIQANGLDLWIYLNGPWRHELSFLFPNEGFQSALGCRTI